MPQVVQAYIEDADFRRPDKIKRQILELYREDIEKFGEHHARRARVIFDDLLGQLSCTSKRFKKIEGVETYTYVLYAATLVM